MRDRGLTTDELYMLNDTVSDLLARLGRLPADADEQDAVLDGIVFELADVIEQYTEQEG